MIKQDTDTQEQLIYILSLPTSAGALLLQVSLVYARVLRNGHYGKTKPFIFNPSDNNLAAHDKYLCELLEASHPAFAMESQASVYPLRDKQGAELLTELLASNRCFWGSGDGKPLALGEEREAHFSWQTLSDGTQRLQCRVGGANLLIMPLVPLWYADLANKRCGPLHTEFDPRLASALLAAPAMATEQIKKFYAELQRLEASEKIPERPAKKVKDVQSITLKPQPILRLFGELTTLLAFTETNYNLALAEVLFDYQGVRINCAATTDPIVIHKKHSQLHIQRDLAFEQQAKEHVLGLGLVERNTRRTADTETENNSAYFFICQPRDRKSQLNFMMQHVPALQAQGWQIIVEDNFPLRVIYDAEDWYTQIDDNTGKDWFNFELGINVAGERINILPLLLNLIQQYINSFGIKTLQDIPTGTKLLVQLPDKRYLPLPVERVRGILNILTELYDNESLYGDEKLRLPRLRITQLLELENAMGATKLRWMGGEKLRNLGERLRSFTGIKPVLIPEIFKTALRPYQNEGLNWLQFLREYDLAGILADDMGLGKTIQTLAHIAVEKTAGRMDKPCLVIAPTSLMLNWRVEAERFVPSLKVLTLHGTTRQQHFASLADYDLILTTYPLLVRDKAVLLKQQYHLLILDEAQIIKNAKAKSTQIVQQLIARHRICLTGTPMENHLGELWSLFNFLLPGLLGSQAEFKRLFATPIEKYQDKDRQLSLAKRVAPFMLRRTKQEVIKELPSKTDIVCNVELEGAQLDLYESIRIAMHDKVMSAIRSKGMERSHIIVLDALLKLRQVCCDPRLLKLSAASNIEQSAKLNLLMDMLPNLIEEGRRILLFSSFTSMLKLIEADLIKQNFAYEKLTGQTRDRATPIQRFQNGEVPLFLISLKAGGLGLNLTAADTVIHYDPWWNPAAEHQATDRAYRIGQDKAVFVYKLVTTGTVEEKIIAMQSQKQALLEGLFNQQTETKTHLNAEDLEYLFKPLSD